MTYISSSKYGLLGNAAFMSTLTDREFADAETAIKANARLHGNWGRGTMA